MKKIFVPIASVVVLSFFCASASFAQKIPVAPSPRFSGAKFIISLPASLAADAETLLMKQGVILQDIELGPCDTNQVAVCIGLAVGAGTQTSGGSSIYGWGGMSSFFSSGYTSGMNYPVGVIFLLVGNGTQTFLGGAVHDASVMQGGTSSSFYGSRFGVNGYNYSDTDANSAIAHAADSDLVMLLWRPNFWTRHSTSIVWDPFASQRIANAFNNK